MGWDRANCPPEYLLMRAARYIGVPAWELEERPLYWYKLALACESAEAEAEEEAYKLRRRH